jgi:hypothetical protein
MKFLKIILLFFFFFVFGQISLVFANTTVQLNLQTETSIATDNLSNPKKYLLYSEIARTCIFEKNFINYWERDDKSIAKTGSSFTNQIDNTILRLKNAAKFELDNTGRYADVFGHHPLCKSAFRDNFPTEAAFKQYYDEAFSISVPQLEKYGGKGIHAKITGEQNSLYTAWRKANPNTKMAIDDMTNIEIQAMVNKGIPQDIATGWVVKALEKLKAQGITDIKNIPWNGIN